MRVTPFSTEDCLDKIPNQFEITLIAAKRTRELRLGATPKIVPHIDETERSTALREIAAGKIGSNYLNKE